MTTISQGGRQLFIQKQKAQTKEDFWQAAESGGTLTIPFGATAVPLLSLLITLRLSLAQCLKRFQLYVCFVPRLETTAYGTHILILILLFLRGG